MRDKYLVRTEEIKEYIRKKRKIESEMVEEGESINIKMSKSSMDGMDVGYTEIKKYTYNIFIITSESYRACKESY